MCVCVYTRGSYVTLCFLCIWAKKNLEQRLKLTMNHILICSTQLLCVFSASGLCVSVWVCECVCVSVNVLWVIEFGAVEVLDSKGKRRHSCSSGVKTVCVCEWDWHLQLHREKSHDSLKVHKRFFQTRPEFTQRKTAGASPIWRKDSARTVEILCLKRNLLLNYLSVYQCFIFQIVFLNVGRVRPLSRFASLVCQYFTCSI